jgi:nucleoid DNA-binding protein
VNKGELVAKTARRTGLSRRRCDIILKAAFVIIRETGHLEYRGFGVFRTKITGVRPYKLGWNGEQNVTLGKKKLVFDESKTDPRTKTKEEVSNDAT